MAKISHLEQVARGYYIWLMLFIPWLYFGPLYLNEPGQGFTSDDHLSISEATLTFGSGMMAAYTVCMILIIQSVGHPGTHWRKLKEQKRRKLLKGQKYIEAEVKRNQIHIYRKEYGERNQSLLQCFEAEEIEAAMDFAAIQRAKLEETENSEKTLQQIVEVINKGS